MRALLLLVILAVAGVYFFGGSTFDSKEKGDAWKLCREEIVSIATRPSDAKIPYVSGLDGGDEYLLSWPRDKGLILVDDFGFKVASSASCTVSKSTGRLTSFSINGKTYR